MPRPAVVFVRHGEARLVVRRQTHHDLILQDEREATAVVGRLAIVRGSQPLNPVR